MNFTIGQLAKAGNVNLETIRYYVRRGLIDQPEKPKVGYRLYSETDLQRLLFIKRAQSLGFNLDEIHNLLAMSEGHCTDIQEMAQHKLNSIQSKVADLQRLEAVLKTLVKQCRSNTTDARCPIIESLLNKP